MSPGLMVLLVIAGIFVLLVMSAIRIVQEFERGVIFRLGRVLSHAKGPGLFFIIPVIDRMVKVNLQTVTMNVPPQDVITRDNVTVRVDAVVYFHVVEPIKAIVEIQNYLLGTSQIAQTTLRSVLGKADLDDLLAERERLNDELQTVIDELTEPWGVKVTLVEIKDVDLPDNMQRAMARQAEAERIRRAKVINAEGEFQASAKLAEAAGVIAQHPIAYQLRLLQTMSEVAAEKNSTLVLPIPVELFRFLEAATKHVGGESPSSDDPAALGRALQETGVADVGTDEDVDELAPESEAPEGGGGAGGSSPTDEPEAEGTTEGMSPGGTMPLGRGMPSGGPASEGSERDEGPRPQF